MPTPKVVPRTSVSCEPEGPLTCRHPRQFPGSSLCTPPHRWPQGSRLRQACRSLALHSSSQQTCRHQPLETSAPASHPSKLASLQGACCKLAQRTPHRLQVIM